MIANRLKPTGPRKPPAIYIHGRYIPNIDPDAPDRELNFEDMLREMVDWDIVHSDVDLATIPTEFRCNGLKQENPGCTSGNCYIFGRAPVFVSTYNIKVVASLPVLGIDTRGHGGDMYFMGHGRCNVAQKDTKENMR